MNFALNLRSNTFHQLHEPPEEVLRVVGPGRRFGVVLHREERLLGMGQPLDGLIVQVHVRELGEAAQRRDVDGEAVVL